MDIVLEMANRASVNIQSCTMTMTSWRFTTAILVSLESSLVVQITLVLTLKAPPIICSRRQFKILQLFQKIANKV